MVLASETELFNAQVTLHNSVSGSGAWRHRTSAQPERLYKRTQSHSAHALPVNKMAAVIESSEKQVKGHTASMNKYRQIAEQKREQQAAALASVS